MSSLIDSINQFYETHCHEEILKYKSIIKQYGIVDTSLESIKSFVSEFSSNGRTLFFRDQLFSGECSHKNFREYYPELKKNISYKFPQIISEIIFKEAPEVINIEKVYAVKRAYDMILEVKQFNFYPFEIPGIPIFNSPLDHFNFHLNLYSGFEDGYPEESVNVNSYITEISNQLVDSQSSLDIKHNDLS